MEVRELTEEEELAKRGLKKVIQINAKGKKWFCSTPEEQSIFTQNNRGVKVETFRIELPIHDADNYMNDPENKKQFTRRKE